MSRVKLGIIGYGGFGRFLHQAWESLPGLEISAVAKRNPEPSIPAAVKTYRNWPDLVSDPEIQVVAITAPPNLHAEIACAALKAGKHVLIEKPLATTVPDARRILNTAKPLPLVASVNFILRFNPIVEALVAIWRSNVLGQLRRFNVENYASDGGLPFDHWFWDQDISGGIFIEHAVHFIDLANQLTTQLPIAVTGYAHRRNQRQEDQVLASILYDGGLMATHYHHFARPHNFEHTSIRLSFDRGQIDLCGWIPLGGHLSALVDADQLRLLATLPGFKVIANPEHLEAVFGLDQPKQQVYASCARALMVDFLEAVVSPGHQPRVTLEDGLASLMIASMARDTSRQALHPVVHTSEGRE